MTKIIMIADDLTGANANCSLMKKVGLKAASIISLDYDLPNNFDAITYTTNSRSMEINDAYNSVREAMEKLIAIDTKLISKRVDSTLRGNIGVEINAVFDGLSDDYIAIAAPSYPETGRIIVNGIMLVNGSLLLNTDAGKDTKTPVFSSKVEEIFQQDFKGKIKSIYLEDIEKGWVHIKNIISQERRNGTKLLLFDGVTNQHLNNIALATVAEGGPFFSIDPGPFSMMLAKELKIKKITPRKTLMVIGSVTDITITQINEIIDNFSVNIVSVKPENLIHPDLINEEIINATKKGLDYLNNKDYLLVTTTPYKDPSERLNLSKLSKVLGTDLESLSLRISSGLAQIAANILTSDKNISGVYLSGGDITVALVGQLEASGINILEELAPLVAYGELIGGKIPSLPLISKGGMVGDKDTMKKCITKLDYS